MWAGVRLFGLFEPANQLAAFIRGQRHASPDGGVAGHRVEQPVLPGVAPAPLGYFIENSAENRTRRFAVTAVCHHGGNRPQDYGRFAERLSVKPGVLQLLAMQFYRFHLARIELDRLRHEQRLGFGDLRTDPLADLFVQDALVSGVLVHQIQAIRPFRQDVGFPGLPDNPKNGQHRPLRRRSLRRFDSRFRRRLAGLGVRIPVSVPAVSKA